MIRTAVRALAQPFPPSELPLGTFVSPLDVESALSGERDIPSIVAAPGPMAVGDALVDFFEDTRARRALAKACHVAFEQRLRVVAIHVEPPERHGLGPGVVAPSLGHPLDSIAWRTLRIDRPAPMNVTRRGARWRILVSLIFKSVRLITNAAAIGIRFGRRRVEATYFVIGAPAGVFDRWSAFRDASEKLGLWRANAILIICQGRKRLRTSWPPSVSNELLPVEAARWHREATVPALRLAVRLTARAVRSALDPWTLQAAVEAIGIAQDSMPVRQLEHSHRFSWFVDVEEYAARHIVKGIILGKSGARLVRWPHSVMNAPGAALSYLGYDLFLAPGPYVPAAAGNDRQLGALTAAVGMVQNDTHLVGTATAIYRDTIFDFKTSGGQIAAYFLPSALPYRNKLIASTLRVLARVFADRPGWLLVIKPKGRKSANQLDSILRADTSLATMLRTALIVRYHEEGEEPCPSGFVISEMDVGVGFGSVPYEALTRDKPVFVYYPVIHPSPPTDKMVDVGLMHKSPATFEAALIRWLDQPNSFNIPYEWFRELFDPFGDANALTRVVRYLLDPANASTVVVRSVGAG